MPVTKKAATSRKVKRPTKPRASARSQTGNAAARKYSKKLSDLEETTGKAILIHGPTGSGKTTLAIHKAPRPILILNADDGLDSIIGTSRSDDIEIWEPKDGGDIDWEIVDEFRNYVVSGDWQLPFKTIVADNVTAIQKPVISEAIRIEIARLDPEKQALRDPDIPSQSGWGKIYRMLDKWIRDVKSAKRMGVHVVFTAGTSEWMDEEAGYSKMMPDIEGKERNQIATHMDAVGWLDSDEEGRSLHLAPSGAFITKVRLPIASHGNEPDEIKNPDFKKMLRAIKGESKKGSKPTTNRKRQKK